MAIPDRFPESLKARAANADLDWLVKDEKKRADTIVFRHLINATGTQTGSGQFPQQGYLLELS